MFRYLGLAATLTLVGVAATCAGCSTHAGVGVRPWRVGVEANCDVDASEEDPGYLPDGCIFGVEVGGWRFGIASFLDIGPVSDAEADAR